MDNVLSQHAAGGGRTGGIGILMVVLALVVAAVFVRVSTAGFIDLDDGTYVEANPQVLGGLSPENIVWALTTDHAGYWVPLTWLSLELDATLTGPAPKAADSTAPVITSAAVYHLDNLIEHVCAAVVLFLFLNRATKRRWASFAVALIWAIHPLRVESVAWVTERKDVLAGIFGFLALYLYVVWTERRGKGLFGLMCVSFAMSMMAKPMFLTFPFVLLLLDVWPLKRFEGKRDWGRLVREKWVVFLIMGVIGVIAFFAQRSVHAIMALKDVGIALRAENALLSYVRYLWMQVSFGRLGIFYPYLGRAAWWEVAGALGLLGGVTGLVWWQRGKRPWLLVGWLWYLGTLVPMIGLVQAGEQAYADRFTYLPTVGILVAVFFSVPARWYEAGRARWWVWGGIGVVGLVLAVFTIRQVEFWQDPIRLDERTLAVTESNYVIRGTMGATYMREGRPDLALPSYEEALRINPGYETARIGLGAIFLTVRRPDLAAGQFAKAVEEDAGDPEAHNLFGIALATMGRMDEAIAEFSTAAGLNPADQRVRGNLARALAERAHQPAATGTRPGS